MPSPCIFDPLFVIRIAQQQLFINKIRRIFFPAIPAIIIAFGLVTLIACSKDRCKNSVCANGGLCVSGSCSCAPGYEDTTCTTEIRSKYVGDFTGNGTDTSGNTYTNWSLSFSSAGTSVTGMQLAVKNATGATQFTFPITLAFNTIPTGFYIDTTAIGAFTYTGWGSVSATLASAVVYQAGSPALVITYGKFIRQ